MILLLGRRGQIGWELQRSLAPLGQVVAMDRSMCDLADTEAIRRAVRENRPTIIVNAAAFTDVDGAEVDTEAAIAINTSAPRVLAEEADRLGAVLVHYSTDYVFNGAAGQPYRETDDPDPINTYGQTKLDGERGIQDVGGQFFILRTSWVYSLRKPCFVNRIRQWISEKDEIRVVDDQFGSPTWCRLAAEATALMLAHILGKRDSVSSVPGGVFHLAGSGGTSRFDLAQEVMTLTSETGSAAKEPPRLSRAVTAEFPTAASRPPDTRLDVHLFETTFGLALPDWRSSLALALEDHD